MERYVEVGNTPVIELSDKLYGKLESVNPGGSIKDRPVKYILDRMKLKKGDTVIEATSGNTGISLAMMCAERGLNCVIVMPSNMSEERKTLLKMFGAELIEVKPGDFERAIEIKDDMVLEGKGKSLHQFTNPLNIECHREELFNELRISSYMMGDISAFIAGTGTGGTLMGVQQGFKDYGWKGKIIAVEPAENAVMSGGKPGLHGIEGIGDGSKYLVDLNKVDEIITITTEEAKERSRRLAKEMGLFVGISAGANVLASERWIENNKPEGIVFTILCDRGERYCSVL